MTIQRLALLRRVRLRIDTGTPFICWALEEDHDAELAGQVQKEIVAGIAPYYTLFDWIATQCSGLSLTSEVMHLARLAWIDKLIYDLEHPHDHP